MMAFIPLANLVDLYDGFLKPCKVNGQALLLVQDQGRTYLIEDKCPHMEAPLYTGKVDNQTITCRVHGIAFDLVSGKARGPLADTLECLKFFDVAYDGNKVGIEV